jgi:hypothetical protein
MEMASEPFPDEAGQVWQDFLDNNGAGATGPADGEVDNAEGAEFPSGFPEHEGYQQVQQDKYHNHVGNVNGGMTPRDNPHQQDTGVAHESFNLAIDNFGQVQSQYNDQTEPQNTVANVNFPGDSVGKLNSHYAPKSVSEGASDDHHNNFAPPDGNVYGINASNDQFQFGAAMQADDDVFGCHDYSNGQNAGSPNLNADSAHPRQSPVIYTDENGNVYCLHAGQHTEEHNPNYRPNVDVSLYHGNHEFDNAGYPQMSNGQLFEEPQQSYISGNPATPQQMRSSPYGSAIHSSPYNGHTPEHGYGSEPAWSTPEQQDISPQQASRTQGRSSSQHVNGRTPSRNMSANMSAQHMSPQTPAQRMAAQGSPYEMSPHTPYDDMDENTSPYNMPPRTQAQRVSSAQFAKNMSPYMSSQYTAGPLMSAPNMIPQEYSASNTLAAMVPGVVSEMMTSPISGKRAPGRRAPKSPEAYSLNVPTQTPQSRRIAGTRKTCKTAETSNPQTAPRGQMSTPQRRKSQYPAMSSGFQESPLQVMGVQQEMQIIADQPDEDAEDMIRQKKHLQEQMYKLDAKLAARNGMGLIKSTPPMRNPFGTPPTPQAMTPATGSSSLSAVTPDSAPTLADTNTPTSKKKQKRGLNPAVVSTGSPQKRARKGAAKKAPARVPTPPASEIKPVAATVGPVHPDDDENPPSDLFGKEVPEPKRCENIANYMAGHPSMRMLSMHHLLHLRFSTLHQYDKARVLLPILNGVHPIEAEKQNIKWGPEYGAARQAEALDKAIRLTAQAEAEAEAAAEATAKEQAVAQNQAAAQAHSQSPVEDQVEDQVQDRVQIQDQYQVQYNESGSDDYSNDEGYDDADYDDLRNDNYGNEYDDDDEDGTYEN